MILSPAPAGRKQSARGRRPSVLFAASAVIVVFGVMVMPGYAVGGKLDRASTKTYLYAVYELLRLEQLELSVSKANANELINRISRECSSVITGEYRTKGAATLNLEVGGALTIVMSRPDRGHTAGFIRTVSALHWDDRRLAKDVRTYLLKLRAEQRLTRLPDICADARAWVQGGFQNADASSVEFVREVEAAEAGPEDVPMSALKRYEDLGDHRLVQRITGAEKHFENTGIRSLLSAWARLLKVIGLR